MPRTLDHRLTVTVQGREIDGWESAVIESDLLTPADAFTLTHRYDPDVFALLRLDADITLFLDGYPVMRGFIESRRGDWQQFTVSGKDRVSRMVAESAPIELSFVDRDLADVAAALAAPWFERVVFGNADNRILLRGAGRKARAQEKPLLTPRVDERKVAPGDSKWEALDAILDRAGYLAWSSADGRDLIITRPDFEQDVQFAFHVTKDGSNCAGISYKESNTSRYALIVTIGAGRGDSLNYAAHTAQRVGVARDEPDAHDGVGNHFLHPKRLILPVDTRSVEECQRLADRERAEREAVSMEVEIRAFGWGQVIEPATRPTLYAPDIVISAFAENTPVDGSYYATARTFTLSRHDQETRLRCVPLGVSLT